MGIELSQRTNARAEVIFHERRQDLFRHIDRLFGVLMAVQWVAAIAAAYWLTPYTWAGSTWRVHVHIWAAVVLGGVISVFPIALAIWRPGQVMTRHAIGIGQMCTSALLIHLTGGRIETHFHVFGSLAFLAFYRDWRVLVPATIVVATDHLLRGIYFPESVYGVLAASQWRWLEHAGWVIFEDIVLVSSCLRGTRDLRDGAKRTAELELSEERHRAFFESDLAGNYRTDNDGRILACNAAFARLLGFGSTQEAMAANTKSFYPRPEERAAFLQLLCERRSLTDHESILKRQDGTVISVLESAVGTFDASGNVIEVQGFLIDISERKRMELELASARDAALTSARLKSEFLANMSHEIRTPMNGVLGMTGLLLDSELSSTQREYAQMIQTSADSLLTVINDILDFSKVEAGKLHFEVLDFDLTQAVEGVVDLLAERAHRKGVELTTEIASDVPTHLRGDPGRLRQIITNLLGNAVKFTERGEVNLRVTLAEAGEADALVRIEVRDTGIGIPEASRGRLFEAFTQADGSTTRRFGGTGLGLAIARQLVALMSGSIGVDSAEGQGSTFWFTARFEKQPGAWHPTSTFVPALANRRILVVDDNRTALAILARQLTAWGVSTETALTATDAAATLRSAAAASCPFHVVFIDCAMPGMDGVELARAIRSDTTIAATRLIAMTAIGRLDDDPLRDAGFGICVTKPVKPAQLRKYLLDVEPGMVTGNQRAIARTPGLAEPARRARILMAEDNVINQKVAATQLRRLGYSVDTVWNGVEALEALARIPYDIVLMDCHMPELDGYEAARAIRSMDHPARLVPIVALTANALTTDRQKCIDAGMDDYLTKPIHIEELRAVLEKWDCPCSESRTGEALVREVVTSHDSGR